MKLSRRELAALAAAASAHAAQQPEDEIKAARESGRRTGEALAKVKVPVETEPAFLFKA